MRMSNPLIDPGATLPAQLKTLREARKLAMTALAAKAGVTRLTAAAAEGKSDPRLSTLAGLFDALGYVLLPVPKHMAREVAGFINNGGRQVSLPAGVEAPLSIGLAEFLRELPDSDPAVKKGS